MIIRKAVGEEDHKNILKISKQSRYTRDFSNRVMFSSAIAYHRGWIRVVCSETGGILGFTCVRHKVRKHETSLYFIGVDEEFQGKGLGVGRSLMEDLMEHSPHDVVVFNVMRGNKALGFYLKLGAKIVGESMGGAANKLELRRFKI